MLISKKVIIKVFLTLALLTIVSFFLNGLLSFYYFGGRFLGLSETPLKISEIVASSGDTISANLLKGYLQIKEGDSVLNRKEGLFASDILKKQQMITKMSPTLASLSVSRNLSTGVVRIFATERIPLMRIMGQPMAIDKYGTVFVYKKGIDQLVAIEGLSTVFVKPGQKVVSNKMALSAIRLMEMLSDNSLAIKVDHIRALNINHEDYIEIFFKNDKIAKLAWENMFDESSETGSDYLMAQLNGLALAIHNTRKARFYDCTIKGRCSAIP